MQTLILKTINNQIHDRSLLLYPYFLANANDWSDDIIKKVSCGEELTNNFRNNTFWNKLFFASHMMISELKSPREHSIVNVLYDVSCQ